MKQLYFVKANKVEWKEVPEPIINNYNQAIVKPIAIARCDLDLPLVRGETLFRPPFPLGHEFIAEIKQLSDDLYESYKIGQIVVVMFQISCGYCQNCIMGNSQYCSANDGPTDYGMGKSGREFGGAIADLVKVPYARQMLLPLEENDDFVSLASLSDNMTDAYRTVYPYLLDKEKNSVLIVGGLAKSISLYAILFAKALNAEKIAYIALDIKENQEQLFKAEKFGSEVHAVKKFPVRWNEFYDVVVDASGNIDGFNMALRSVRVEGICTSVGIFFNNKIPLPYLDMYNRNITLKLGRTKAKEYSNKVLQLIRDNNIDIGNIVSTISNWSDVKESWLEPAVKMIIKGPN